MFVLAFGIERFARVESDGRFRFGNLAEAAYDLRIISTLDDYGVVDTAGVRVEAGDTTNLDTISLPFTGIPSVKGLTLEYDTMKQIVTLRWERGDTAVVKSYNVYRRNVDSNTVAVRINSSPVADTVYRDSTGVQDETYEYWVAGVDGKGREGEKGKETGVRVMSRFVIADTIDAYRITQEESFTIWDMTCDKEGNLFIASCNNRGNNPRIQKFNGSRSNLISIDGNDLDKGQFIEPKGIAVNQMHWIFVSDRGNCQVQIFDSTGTFVMSISGQLSDSSKLLSPREITVDDSAIYIADYSNNEYYSTVKKFDFNGNFLLKWGAKGDAPGQFRMIWSIKVTSKGELAILDENGIQFFTKNGLFLRRIPTTNYGNIQDLDIRDTIIYASSYEGKVFLLNEIGNYLAKFDLKRKELFQIAANEHEIFLYFFDTREIIVIK